MNGSFQKMLDAQKSDLGQTEFNSEIHSATIEEAPHNPNKIGTSDIK